MKNHILIIFSVFTLALKTFAADPPAEFFSLTPSVTLLAASSTNTTAGTIKQLSRGESPVRIWASCSGIPATTNGVSSVSNIVVILSTAAGSDTTTNLFDTPNFSTVSLTIPVTGNGNTNVVSTLFDFTGSRFIRVGQIQNNTLGIVSNIIVNVGY